MFNLSKAYLKKVNPSSGGERKFTNQKRKNRFSINSAIGMAIDDMHHQKIKQIWSLKSLLFLSKSLAPLGRGCSNWKTSLKAGEHSTRTLKY